ncbi:uncharacterized protein [Coffea arabica]|uniref:Retrotransposon gag domain-containing protein n=1 Tax=Coffea arabica TaxID=13443 RepID=A0ABM4UEW3_COFAR
MVDEFIRFRQGTQTVAEYESQFTQLFKFAPELIMTEQRQIRRFVPGLNVEIQKNLTVAQINAFSEAVEKAQRVESARLQVRNFQAKKREFPGSNSLQGDKSTPPKFGRGTGGGRLPGMSRGAPSRGGQVGRGQRGGSQGGSASTPRDPCGYCEKPNHTEDNCWRKERKCLHCGSADHQIPICPVLPREGSESQQSTRTNSGQAKVEGAKPKVLARVYSLESQQVPDSSEVVEGERKLLGDLISLSIKGYDVMLGMDWLTRYNAQLDCKRKVVEFHILGEATLRLNIRGRLVSSALISGIRVRKLLSRGAQGFSAFLINTPTDKLKVKDVQVVKEYPDVFPDELVTLLPEREIKFKIDLLPEISPISKTPYRMAPAELRELKLQLQDLLKRGFIRESGSP